jgi:hypothetical protein
LKKFRGRDRSFRYKEYDYHALAVYNSERSRGLVHTEEYQDKMRQQQERFNKEMKIRREKYR